MQVSLLASYVVELALVDAGMLKHSYSTIAAASVYVAMKVWGFRGTGGRAVHTEGPSASSFTPIKANSHPARWRLLCSSFLVSS